MQVQTAARSNDEGRAFIEQLRRSKFMIGMPLPKEAEAAAEGLRRDLSNALRLLSDDLYSTETHFVLELIQNADDNTYTHGIAPQIRISLTPKELTIWNNEQGFRPENVTALCSVGQSTKAKKAGFIGEKGIGFKSVFQVSDTPEIHSNGFHFRFDMSDPEKHLGYIVPHQVAPGEALAADGTTIILPAKKEQEFSISVLNELDARLLLFLRKLRQIELRTPAGDTSMRCIDEDGLSALEISRPAEGGAGTEERERFLRVASSIDMTASADDKRPLVSESELVLAFPVSDAGKAITAPNCATFSFLPIRNFGFRFCIQADFLLSSAREDIQTARPWNGTLRDGIATAFVESLEQFKARPGLARTFLNYLPRQSEIVNPFFVPVIQQTFDALAGTSCILCASGNWRQPSEVVTASSAFQRLVPAQAAWELFGKDYPANDLDVDAETLKKLGCTPLMISDVVRLFGEHGPWVLQQGYDWLGRFYGYLATLNRENLLKSLRDVPCVPVSDGTLHIPSKRAVFFPLAKSKKFGFEKDLLILNDAFVDVLRANDNVDSAEAVRGLLHDLDVRIPEPYTLITNDILPAHRSDSWQEAEFEALTGHVRYVKEKLDDYLAAAFAHGVSEISALKTLGEGLQLKTRKHDDDTWWFARAADVYLGHDYRPEFDIENLLGDALDPLRVLSPDYLPEATKKKSDEDNAATFEEWRQFFLRLGVSPSPCLSKDTPPACSAELTALLASEAVAARRQTLECLDRHWERYSGHVTYTLSNRTGTRYYTPFANTLRSTVAPSRQRRQVPLKETYYATTAVKEVFGTSPSYIDAELRNEGFLDACGIVHRVDVNACIARLKQIKASERPSASQVRPLYRHLDQLVERHAASALQEAFKEHALVLTRQADSPWKRPDEVVWSPPGEFLSLHFPALGVQYQELHGFFVRKLDVSTEVSVASAIGVLPLLAEADLTADVRASEALRIYQRANRELINLAGAEPQWLEDLQTQPAFLNHRGEMVVLDETLFADDQPATGALFADQEGISFLAVPPTRLPQIHGLLEAAGLPLLSASLEVTLENPGEGRINATYTARVRERFRHIARLVYNQSNAGFERAKDAGQWRRLSMLTVVDVEQLTILNTLHGHTVSTQGEVVIADEAAYVRVGAKGVADRLAREICLMLKAPTQIDGVSRILLEERLADVEEYLDVRELAVLPDDELSQLTIEQVAVATEGTSPAGSDSDDEDEASRELAPQPTEPPKTTASTSEATSRKWPPNPFDRTASPPDGEPATRPGTTPPAQSANRESRPPDATSTSGTHTGEQNRPAITPAWNRPAPSASTPTQGWTGSPRGRRDRLRQPRSTSRNDKGQRLLSYVVPDSAQTSTSENSDVAPDRDDRALERDATAQAAVRYVLQTQRDKWASLEEMPFNNKGFDIRAIAHDGSEHVIEVKGQSGAWTAAGISMTPSELLCASERRTSYWLCIVEQAIHPGREVVHLVNNPFGKADEFRFDSGWKAVATTESGPPPLAPAAGMGIEIPDLGMGTIASVKKGGSMFCKLHVYLADGRQVFRVFDPARMRLFKES